jgi:hypothetical protein
MPQQPPVPDHGADDQSARESGAPAGSGVASGAVGGRDARLAAFAPGGGGDAMAPSWWTAMVLDELSGPARRCRQASDAELDGLLGRWAAVESWAAAGKLGVLAEVVRRRARPGHENARRGDMPSGWEEDAGHAVALTLAASVPGADKLIGLAVDLACRLPGTYAALAAGRIDVVKAMVIARELSVLDDMAAAAAEALILAHLDGKTAGQVGKLAAAAAVTVDPAGAEKRREQAERDDARVRLWREQGGACALAGYGLPTDAALAANANIAARARQYKDAKIEATMDQLRVLAFLDILNQIPAATRIAQARAAQASAQDVQPAGRPGSAGQPGRPGSGPASGEPAGDDDQAPGTPGGDGPAGNSSGPAAGSPGGNIGDDRSSGDPGGNGASAPSGGQPADHADAGPALAASTNLTITLATLLGLADRPGEGHGLGPLDPALARDLAAAAARSPHSTWHITITSPDGTAIGHGCARTRTARTRHGKAPPAPGATNKPWAFTRRDGPGPPDGYGAWTLTLPDGRDLTVDLHPIPVYDCDHRYQTRAYQPGALLRHLVQVRDGECTFPACSRHARETDFEHAIPYDQGGKTCACNAGARSRRCHKVKQTKGWTLTQPRPGFHQWTTPSGRTITQGPKRYPA